MGPPSFSGLTVLTHSSLGLGRNVVCEPGINPLGVGTGCSRGEVGASQGTHGHVALGRGEGLGRQHVRLHQIAHVDPVHPCPAVPKAEHEQPLLDVALGVEERDDGPYLSSLC